MRVFRITSAKYVGRALSGEGAARAPGRWNSHGIRMGYTAQSESLAKLEMLVHIDRQDVPTGYRILTIEVPDDAIEVLDLDVLPEGWGAFPYDAAVRNIGDRWIAEGRSLALRVPSVVARTEWNLLVNPAHARAGEILLSEDEPLAFDPRLFP
jgi:RES domain-containing protein